MWKRSCQVNLCYEKTIGNLKFSDKIYGCPNNCMFYCIRTVIWLNAIHARHPNGVHYKCKEKVVKRKRNCCDVIILFSVDPETSGIVAWNFTNYKRQSRWHIECKTWPGAMKTKGVILYVKVTIGMSFL